MSCVGYPGRVGRGRAALIGAIVGAAVGIALLLALHPTAAYTNDAYRQGASVGYVIRYAVLGLVGALLLRVLRGGRRPALAGLGLAVVLAAAILPPVLDEDTPSERRSAAATKIASATSTGSSRARRTTRRSCAPPAKRSNPASRPAASAASWRAA